MKDCNQDNGTATPLPKGARFFKCALQVNPYAYVKRHGYPSAARFKNEDEYNAAIVASCQKQGIEVIAVTDHYRIDSAESLIEKARVSGLKVFPGFEAVTKDGVHLLCLFDLDVDAQYIGKVIANCDILEDKQDSPIGKYDTLEFLDEARRWHALCIAAHVATNGGLLERLSGQTRMKAWKSPHLLACALPGSLQKTPANLQPILENKNRDYQRSHRVAIINANDVSQPDDFGQEGCSCWIKMSGVSLEGLRQAFLDPYSRIRLNSDPPLQNHAELVSLAWEGGFLDGVTVPLNPSLNVLIGGRGAGKSTIIESIRYALNLDPVGQDAAKAHAGIIKQVLGSGTKISLTVRTYRPQEQKYRIERTVAGMPEVRDENDRPLRLAPQNILPRVEVYGQHEIAELARDAERRTRLLHRFVENKEAIDERKLKLRQKLQKSRQALADVRAELQEIDEQLDALPGLLELLATYKKAGFEKRLRERSLLAREQTVIEGISERLQPFVDSLDMLRGELPIDLTFLSARALKALPGQDILSDIRPILTQLSCDLDRIAQELKRTLDQTETDLEDVRSHWEAHRKDVQAAFEKILRELHEAANDGEAFIQLQHRIETLQPLKEKQSRLVRWAAEYETERQALLREWDNIQAEELRLFTQAARNVSKQLRNQVQVEMIPEGNREPFYRLLRSEIGGRLDRAMDAFAQDPEFSLRQFVETCRKGSQAVQQRFNIPVAQAERLAGASDETLMKIEELQLPMTTEIRFNAASGDAPHWQAIEDLSTGQKATAVLLLLLLESDEPLIVDQLEDDLDNRFITEGIVPKMRSGKFHRQYLFTTHNANVPVLGDAEMVLGLTASGEAGNGQACILREHMGSIDTSPVRELVEEILEGGKTAFETRRLKYGF